MQLHPERRRGSTLVGAVIFIAVITGATGLALMSTSTLGRNVQRTRLYENAIAVGDAHLEWEFAQWRSICRSAPNQALPGANFKTAIGLPPSAWLPEPIGYSVNAATYGVVAADVEGRVLTNLATQPPAAQG